MLILCSLQVDQENVAGLVEQWTAKGGGDQIFFRPRMVSKDQSIPMLFCYQAEWQQRLLCLYGQEMVLLDATYRVCRYSVPLFFLCVRTNMQYVVVAAFITNSEAAQDIQEALDMIKSWNSTWKPKAFMMDFSPSERSAVQAIFPGK